jgi:hypothetical protein
MVLLRQTMPGILIVLSLLVSTGCGSAGSGGSGGGSVAGGIGGTGAVAQGEITGFGSIFVNGIEFATDGSTFDVDDDSVATEGDLALGMVVTVIGTINNDGVTGTANSITYDDDVEGPVGNIPLEDADGITKTFTVFGITVVVNKGTTVFSGSGGYDSIKQNDLIEVSGFFNEVGSLVATRVENEGELIFDISEVEIKGTVFGFIGTNTFTVNGITVFFDGATDLSDMPVGIANGQFVEVKGVLDDTYTISATRIELEDEGLEDTGDKVSIEGFVSEFNNVGNFKVSGKQVNAAAAVFEPSSLGGNIANGDKVEVEGPVNGGVLQAVRVEQRGGNVRISAVVNSRNAAAGTVTLIVVSGQPVLTINTNSQTQLEDDRDDAEPFSVAGINAGDYLEVGGFIDGGGNIVASKIKRDELDRIELRGPVDGPPLTEGDEGSGKVSILGVTIQTSDLTDFEDALFFDHVSEGDLVEFRDDQPADGIADEVEFED